MPPSSVHSVNSADHPDVESALALTPPPEMAPADERTPNSQERTPEVYDTEPELLVRGRQWISDSDFPLGFTVDASRQAVAPSNAPAIRSCFSRRTPWTEMAKATYRVCIHFYPRLSRSRHSRKPEYTCVVGTAIHVGEGLFLTNLHVVKWVYYQHSHISHIARIWLFSGIGNLDKRVAKEPSIISKGSLEVKLVGWPGSAFASALNPSYAVQGGLMTRMYGVDPRHDFCLLEATEKRWKDTFRRGSRPHVLPDRLDNLPITFTATFVGINGPTEDMSKYDLHVNSLHQLRRTLSSLLPGVISYVTTSLATQSLGGREPSPVAGRAELIRYPISSTGGSSGSGIYENTTKRLVGIHSRSELDPVCVLQGVDQSLTSPNDWAVAIALDSPEFKDFARTIMIPHLRRIGTSRATGIADEWAGIAT